MTMHTSNNVTSSFSWKKAEGLWKHSKLHFPLLKNNPIAITPENEEEQKQSIDWRDEIIRMYDLPKDASDESIFVFLKCASLCLTLER